MEATKILNQRNVLIIPDVLASSGGGIVSYFEWVQNNLGYYWSEEEVSIKLRTKLIEAFNHVIDTAALHKIDNRLAAYMVGSRKMAEASKFRGWI